MRQTVAQHDQECAAKRTDASSLQLPSADSPLDRIFEVFVRPQMIGT
jgi:hypothetical protein